MVGIKYIFIISFLITSCTTQADPFKWVDTIPDPWLLSETEFEFYLPQFHERFPNYHDRLKALNLWRVGTPYGLFCLGEESGKDIDPLLRADSSDCTVHILTTLAFAESFTWQNARDAMVDIHYKMDKNGEKTPTYISRWHYTSDRLLHHDRTVDITSSIAHENDLEKVEIELNKKEDGSEFLDLNWSSKETIQFIPTVNITENILLNLPAISGIAFVKKSYFKLGIVIAHEGYLIDKTNLIHASSEHKKTVNVDFLSYLFNNGEPRFDGVMFYKINPI
ncbi:MAG: N-acetylmuramoyl-L-alanine amidase-like domain-containing protein [Candidatus Neomarinimicrobiota bacterium]|nr:N-acetylmuramoyl-L-alanine amidase-like domain-containing protein [Candidatus Neomarinimicrobiota bacterium]